MEHHVTMKRTGLLLAALLLLCGIGLLSTQRTAPMPPTPSAESAGPEMTVRTLPEVAKPDTRAKETQKSKFVRVAAIQCAPRMGKVAQNRKMISELVTQAAAQGAKIVVLPECALQGYMNPRTNQIWSKDAEAARAESGEMAVSVVAETVPGASTRHFSALAKQLEIYLALPLIESDGDTFYNSQVLLDPKGEIAARHRKHALWPPGDASWASEGKGPAATVDTPYGRLGLMVCYDVHEMPKKLKEAGAEIVLYSVGWYGPSEIFFTELFPRRYVVPNGFSVIAANWSGIEREPEWEGLGCSCVIDKRGVVLAMAKTTSGSEIVITDLPVGTPRMKETVGEE
jgi:predicted amidohydrolase